MKVTWRIQSFAAVVTLFTSSAAWAQTSPFGSPLLPIPETSSAVGLNSAPTYRAAPARLQGPVTAAPAAAPTGEAAPAPDANHGDRCLDCWNDDGGYGGHGGCGACGGCCDSCNGCCWFGSISALVLTRDNPNRVWTTFETNNNPNQLMNTVDAKADWGWGGEVTIGHWWNGCDCSRTGLALSYFTVDQLEGFASVNQNDVADTVSTTLDFVNGNVTINGVPASDFFDDAEEQRLRRTNEIHNVELNLLCQRSSYGSCMQVTWIAGARFLRFDETLSFGSVDSGFNFGDNGGANEAYLDIRCENNLVGAQIGAQVDYAISRRLGFYVTPKIGIYGNEVSTRSLLYDGTGNVGFDIPGSKTDFSMIAELNLGINYAICNGWRAFGGYRAIAVTGIALSDNQIPFYLAAADEFADPDTNGSLILHGAYFGVEYCF